MLDTLDLSKQSTQSLERFLVAFVALASCYVVASRFIIAAGAPLWLDETWSGMIATRDSWTVFWREAWLDCNPPLYYLLLSFWVSLFGDSNFVLRIPSLILSLSAAVAPILWRPKGLNKTAVYTFSALLLLWPPLLLASTDTRGYSLMLLLSVLSCLTVARLLEQLTLKWTVIWVALGTLMFLNHYFAAMLILGQLIVVAARHRFALLRMWPAAFVAAPGLAWFAIHVPRMREYARPDVTWYDPTTIETMSQHLAFTFGLYHYLPLGMVALFILLMVYRARRDRAEGKEAPYYNDRNLILAALAAGIGFVATIIFGVLQDSLAHRYFIPLVPPALLGLTLILQRCPKQKLLALLLLFVFLIPVLNFGHAKTVAKERATYGYEEASDFVASYKPDQLIFLWDHPATKIMSDYSLKEIGGYFMERQGMNLPVTALVVPETGDSNAMIRASIRGKRPAFIWLYDKGRRSAAAAYPSTFAGDPQWVCRHHHRGPSKTGIGTAACVKLEKNDD